MAVRIFPFRSAVVLAGGVGGAKFADGMARCLPPGTLTVIVNTGDDFQHYGLRISPDLDTVMYTLGGIANPVNGWGLDGDTNQMLGMLRRYGDDAWFGLGDRDVATHLLRTQWLAQGLSLTDVTRRLSQALAIPSAILPMTDDLAPTLIDTLEYGILPFQEYFVRYGWQPTVRQVILPTGVEAASTALAAIQSADLIILGPSNPMLSIEPILGCVGMLEALNARRKLGIPCVAISPIVAGQAIKGPAAKLMQEFALPVTARGVAERYNTLINGMIVQAGDWQTRPIQTAPDALAVLETDVVMHSVPDRARLAEEVLSWANQLVS